MNDTQTYEVLRGINWRKTLAQKAEARAEPGETVTAADLGPKNVKAFLSMNAIRIPPEKKGKG